MLAETPISFLGEQLVVIFTVIGAVAALPALIEFWIDRRKRKQRIALSLDDQTVRTLRPNVAGFEPLLADIADLIDRTARPELYRDLAVGNEVLLIGPSLSGKKMFAQQWAKLAQIDRLITVWNPRNADALAAAKDWVRSYRRRKVMLLLPRVDQVYESGDQELISELDALIEVTSGSENVLVFATATSFKPDSPLDQTFGIKLVLPGTPTSLAHPKLLNAEAQQVIRAVIEYYWRSAESKGFKLEGITLDDLIDRLADIVSNPAEVEDVIALVKTIAIYRRHADLAQGLLVTPWIIDKAISRVGINLLVDSES